MGAILNWPVQTDVIATPASLEMTHYPNFRLVEDYFAPPEGSGEVAEFTSRNHARAVSPGG